MTDAIVCIVLQTSLVFKRKVVTQVERSFDVRGNGRVVCGWQHWIDGQGSNCRYTGNPHGLVRPVYNVGD